MTMARKVVAEFIGTALLVMAIAGAGIAASRPTPQAPGVQILEIALAAGATLVAIITALGPVSGAHFNPAVTIADRAFGGLDTKSALAYVCAQISGGIVGAVVTNAMFSLAIVEHSSTARSSGGLWLAEAVATFGLLLVIFGVVRSGRENVVPFAVGGYISAAILFTASTCFANPAVTIGRIFTDTLTGIDSSSAAAYVAFQLVGMVAAVATIRFLYPTIQSVSPDVVVPHDVTTVSQ